MEKDGFLSAMAGKYIWWQIDGCITDNSERIIAQLMDIGDYEDVQKMLALFDEDYLRTIIQKAQAGWFNIRSWHYWHYKLNLVDFGNVPPLPKRNFDG